MSAYKERVITRAIRDYWEELPNLLQGAAPEGLQKPSPMYRGGLIVPMHKGQGQVVRGNYIIRWEIDGRSDYGDRRVRIYRRHQNRTEIFIATCRLENLRGDGWHVSTPASFKHGRIVPLHTTSRFVTPQDFVQWYIDSGDWLPYQADVIDDEPVRKAQVQHPEPIYEFIR